MIFTVTCDNEEFGGLLDMSISVSRDSTATDILEVFERMALALTYSPVSLQAAYEDRLTELRGIDRLRRGGK
jgi:hypothetical protein